MIVKYNENQEIGASLGFDGSVKATVKEADMGFMFRTLSSSLYTDKLGSLVRETVCNGFDAYVGLDKTPVVVIRYNPIQHSLSFIDKGKGMSREFVENVYVNFFNSTKREESGSFGAFGLGGKVGLSLNNFFYIDTIQNGRRNKYIYSYNNENPMDFPTLDLLEEQDTTEENGTTIEVPLPKGYQYDLSSIVGAVRQQLRYFDSVVLQGFNPYGDQFIGNLYKGKHFILNPDNQARELEICFGKVRYPIDSSIITGIPPELWRLPIALYFDLDTPFLPTPAREGLQYTPETVKLIRDKINLVKEELLELFEKSKYTSSIDDYMTRNRYNRYVKIGGVELTTTFFPQIELTGFEDCHFQRLNVGRFGDYIIQYAAWKLYYPQGHNTYGGIYLAHTFDTKKAKYSRASMVAYDYGVHKMDYMTLIPYFYDPKDINVIPRLERHTDAEGIERLTKVHDIINPKNIDYETEIKKFYAKYYQEQLINFKEKILDDVVVPKIERVKPERAKLDEIKEHDPHSRGRTTIITSSKELLKFKYLVFLDPDTEDKTEYNNFRFNFHRSYEKFSKKAKSRKVVRFISCNKTEQKKLFKYPNIIMLEDFKKTKYFINFVKRSAESIYASNLVKLIVSGRRNVIRFNDGHPHPLEFREFYMELWNKRVDEYNSFVSTDDLNQFKHLEAKAKKYRDYNPSRILKDYYKKQVQRLKQAQNG